MNEKKTINWSGKGHSYTDQDIAAVVEVMKKADPLTQGKYLQQFEADFKKYLGVNHAFAVANCTNALDLAAILCRLRPGDEVIIPAHTFCATAIPFGRTGAKIIWADLDPETLCISQKTIKPLINERTKVVVPVHLYGLMCPMHEIMDLAKSRNIFVVEDCAQAIGASYQGRMAGSFGDLACFSFHGAKNMTTLGEGGMLVVNSDNLAHLVPGLRHNGCCAYPADRAFYWKPAMSNVDRDMEGTWPLNVCLGEAQCALGSSLLKRVDEIADKKIKRAKNFIQAMEGFPELAFQKYSPDYKNVYHLLPARYDGEKYGQSNDDFIKMMFNDYGIRVIVQYYPLYRYPLFQKMGFGQADCPNTDNFFDHMVSFPFHEWLSDDDFNYLIEATQKTLSALRK